MPYSLVGTPALGYDLARSPRGDQAAVVVRTALRCTERDVHLLAVRHRGHEAVASPLAHGGGQLLGRVGEADEALRRAASGDLSGTSEVLARLESARIGGLDAADRFLRHEVLGWCWNGSFDLESQAALAADVLRDAAAPAFDDGLDPRRRRILALPFLGSGVRLAHRSVPTGIDTVDEMLAVLGSLDDEQRLAWRQASDVARAATASWSPAMHEASWALHLSERLRLAADAQMGAVLAYRAAGFEPRDAAYGVWNAISGAVHATVVADLLPRREYDLLLGPWRRVHG